MNCGNNKVGMPNGRNKTFRITSFPCSEPRLVFLSQGVRGPRSLFPLLQSHWTLLSLKNTSTVSEPIQTAVHYEAVLKYSHKAQLPIMKCRLLTTLLNSTTTRTVFYPLSTARLLPTGCKRKNGSSVLLTAVPKGKHRTSSSKKSTI